MDPAARPLTLFVPFYTPRDPERAAELQTCLETNLASGLFERIVLLQDDDTPRPGDDPRLVQVRLESRPTYRDWLRQARALCPGGIAVLANSDILFDTTIRRLRELFAADPGAFVALSRHERRGEETWPHPNPRRSQDTWAMLPEAEVDETMAHQLEIPLGTVRCDNKVAYLFAINGFRLHNPMHQIRSVHLHESEIRYYDRTGDHTLKGGMALVHPAPALGVPSKVETEVWVVDSAQLRRPTLNRALEKWRLGGRPRAPALFAHVDGWTHPEPTEAHALAQMRALMPAAGDQVAYLGFPWAALIERREAGGDLSEDETVLAGFRGLLQPWPRRVTVCQHPRMRDHGALFAAAGITDIFWSHRRPGDPPLPEAAKTVVRAFPRHPRLLAPVGPETADAPRPHLVSDLGAGPGAAHPARGRLRACLGEDARAVVATGGGRRRKAALLAASDFSICLPEAGAGVPLRLWEAVAALSVPVLFDDLRLPGDPDLWRAATVRAGRGPEAIAALPDRLAALAATPGLMRRKRSALHVLAERYGPQRFVHDVLDFVRRHDDQRPLPQEPEAHA
ncbi:hypothetical protein OG2516_18965 [Oceanicola granulosus HTCC2516]|uniref:Uncharacterized protein n=1 Tax=Oceanicola granulosus (strain ATCC BAA-861 / DSM 15982 / KCTC 12143 / HTCC2516) TaxID=314256 RepID=Q2CBS5_OCEGH|nr:hypothetical protein [Oceanicola granulosus]EAR50129.1 hypothetical protein OG2516_18965 [Oceanicola granulosus HTCC2516]